MYEKIIQNNEAFDMMLICTTAMSNSLSPAFIEDAKKVIDFIGEAYSLEKPIIELCADVILGDLMALSLTADRLALYRSRSSDSIYSDLDALFDMKANVIAKLEKLPEETPTLNAAWFGYAHYMAYNPLIRYSILLQTAMTGEIWSAMTVGILTALGIGCKQSYSDAIERLKQCAFWGHSPALLLLAHAYSLNDELQKAADYTAVADLCRRYMALGKTELPENEPANTFVKETFAVISSIYYDVVLGYKLPNINFSFIEAITSPKLSFREVMHFINNFNGARANWRDVTNPSYDNTPKKLGF